MNDKSGLDDLVSAEEIAKIIRVSLPTAYRLIRTDGDFPAPVTILQKHRRWRKASVVEWFNNKLNHAKTNGG